MKPIVKQKLSTLQDIINKAQNGGGGTVDAYTKAEADAKFETIADAASTYLSKSDAASTYISTIDAFTIFYNASNLVFIQWSNTLSAGIYDITLCYTINNVDFWEKFIVNLTDDISTSKIFKLSTTQFTTYVGIGYDEESNRDLIKLLAGNSTTVTANAIYAVKIA